MPDGEGLRLGGLLERSRDRQRIEGGMGIEESVAARRSTSERGDEAEDDVELERLPVDAVPAAEVFYSVARRSSESLRSIFFRAWIILRLRFALGFS
jgi:hypothetical protein